MATYYEVLGVPSDATQVAIKQAFTELARRHHPDRHAGGTPTERAAAERRMQEVTAAWHVLSSPARRAAYDARLRGAPAPGQGGPPRPPRTAPVRPGQAAPPPPSGGIVVPSGAVPFLRFGPAAVVVVVLLGILVFTAYANHQANVAPEQGGGPAATAPAAAYAVGRCVVLASVAGRTTAVPASCTTTGAQEVAALVDLGRPCVAPAVPFDAAGAEQRLCLHSPR